MTLVFSPIFEADFPSEQYGFRPDLDAEMALRRVYFHVAREGVDADLSDYFNTIPRGPLMKCVARRVSDGRALAMIKAMVQIAAVVEREGRQERRTADARRWNRGTPQGGVTSPLLANLYFRRFVLAWRKSPEARVTRGAIVNYADDLVICCRPGTGDVAMTKMRRQLMMRLGLEVNKRKTRLARRPEDRFDFLGYAVGRFRRKEPAWPPEAYRNRASGLLYELAIGRDRGTAFKRGLLIERVAHALGQRRFQRATSFPR